MVIIVYKFTKLYKFKPIVKSKKFFTHFVSFILLVLFYCENKSIQIITKMVMKPSFFIFSLKPELCLEYDVFGI